MQYDIHLARSAEKELKRLDAPVRARVVKAVRKLAEDPRRQGVVALQGHDGYRMRVGDYRVLFLIDDGASRVTILSIGHRRDVYRGL